MATNGRPPALAGVKLIMRRELGAYFGTRAGWVLIALALMVAGILFNARAVGDSARYSSDVLHQFFHDSSGVMLAAAFLVAMRTIVEERRSGTLPLLMNSSLTEGEIVFAKYAAAMVFLAALWAFSAYIPSLVFLRGKVSLGHLATGYLGIMLYGSAVLAVGIWASSFAKGWIVAGAASAATLAVMHTFWLLARVVEGPLGDLLGALAMHDKHFLPFKQGTLSLYHSVFYLAVTAVFLSLARNGLEARRWSS